MRRGRAAGPGELAARSRRSCCTATRRRRRQTPVSFRPWRGHAHPAPLTSSRAQRRRRLPVSAAACSAAAFGGHQQQGKRPGDRSRADRWHGEALSWRSRTRREAPPRRPARSLSVALIKTRGPVCVNGSEGIAPCPQRLVPGQGGRADEWTRGLPADRLACPAGRCPSLYYEPWAWSETLTSACASASP